MSGERICAQGLLEQLRGEVRETLSGFDRSEMKSCTTVLTRPLWDRPDGSICRWGSGSN